MLCTVAMLAQRINVATTADLKAANSMIKQMQETPECILRFSSSVRIPYKSLPKVANLDIESPELLHEPVGVPYLFA
eukprot:3536362-Amphidinium_carterae.1